MFRSTSTQSTIVSTAIVFFLSLFLTFSANAQGTPFPGGNVSSPGVPDTIFVGANCTAPLFWGGDDSIKVSYNLTYFGTKKFKSVSTGTIGSPIPAGTIVTVTYEINYFTLIFPTPQTFLYSFDIYFVDQTPPVFAALPPSVTISCGAAAPIPTVTDNCTAAPTVSFTNSAFVSSCAGGNYIRTWLATDAYGNTATKTQAVTVTPDVTAPVFTASPSPLTVTCDANTSSQITAWLANHGGAVATDDCGSVTWSSVPSLNNLNFACPGSPTGVIVKFTATDACGLTATKTVNFTVNDINPPVVTKVAQSTVANCGSSVSAKLAAWLNTKAGSAASDACSLISTTYQLNGNPSTVFKIDSTLQAELALGNCQNNIIIGSTNYNKVLARADVGFVYKDACGNAAAPTVATFAVIDTIKPTITKQAFSTVVPCSSPNINGAFTIWYNSAGGAVATDSCSMATFVGVPTFANAQDTLAKNRLTGCNNTGSVTVKFYAVDKCGNQNPTPTAALFQIKDTNAPIFTKPAQDLLVECNTNGQAEIQNFIATRAKAVATDNCGAVTWTYKWKDKNNIKGQNTVPTVPSNSCTWFADFTFIASDACGNKDSVVAKFGLKDTQAPVFTGVPPNVTVGCQGIPAVVNPMATDNCATPTITFVQTQAGSNPCDTGYVIIRTWTAKDSCNNIQKAIQKIRVKDVQAPTLTGVPIDITVNCNAVPKPIVVIASDDCDTTKTSKFLEISGQVASLTACGHYSYSIFRTWTATDQCKNTATLAQTIVVEDKVKPSFTVPADATVECYQINDTTFTGNVKNVSDNCMAAPIVTKIDAYASGVCPIVNTITRTWTVSDACANSISKTQTIISRDTKKPSISGVPANVTVACDKIPNPPMVIIKDSCSTNLTIVKDSLMNSTACNGVKTILRRWTATDECNNKASAFYTITTTDTKPPVFVFPIPNITVNNNPSDCDATVAMVSPFVTEECGAAYSNQSLIANNVTLTHSGTGDVNEIVVDPITLSFPVSLSNINVASNVALTINLNDIDGEDVGEYFNIVGEDGSVLGKTNSTPTQCSSSTTIVSALTAQQVNTWGADGSIDIKLVPNVPVGQSGIFAINDICTGANAGGKLTFKQQTSTVNYSIQIDNDPPFFASINTTNNATFGVGMHVVTYIVSDCSNNTSSITYNVTVKDTEKPTMACPTDIVMNANATTCGIPITLALPSSINDNCGFSTNYMQTQPSTANAALLQFEKNPNLLAFMVKPKTFIFTNTTTNILGGPVFIDLEFKGDMDEPSEYFTIADENGNIIGATSTGDCTTANTTSINVSAASYNAWAADGIVTFTATPYSGFSVGTTDPGINPCNNTVTQNGSNDGVSYLKATLRFQTALPKFYTTGATKTPISALIQGGTTATLTFNSGNTKVYYTLEDKAGNIDTCKYSVNIQDITPPVAKCATSTVFINPSGLVSYVIKAAEIDGGSYDNCGIDTAWVTHPALSCSSAGTIVPVTLNVQDKAGNVSTCNTQVRIEVGGPKPTAQLGFCGSDTLRLFANPPAAPGNIVYTYQWSGPNGFQSNVANPILPSVNASNSGSYTVKVQGFSGCDASGSVTVQIANQPNTPTISTPDNTPCTNESIVLQTNSYTGSVKYFWYKGNAPTGMLLDSTITATYSINTPAQGNSRYYVIIKQAACVSNPSTSLVVSVIAPPVALLTTPTSFELCQGNNITLGTPVAGANFTYKWSGPNAFQSTSQYPSVITNVNNLNSGSYTLIIENNGCYSNPVTTSVNVKPLPTKPQLTLSGSTCEGSSVTLITNIINQDVYHWIRPNFNEDTTSSNTLILNNLNNNQNGNWSLYVTKNGCNSEKATFLPIKVNPLPIVAASSNSPVCTNGTLKLNADAAGNATYYWTGPNSFTGIGKTVNAPPVAGTYIVNVISAEGCSAFVSTAVTISNPPVITAVSNNGLPCVTGAQNIKLVPTVTPIDNGSYTYKWTGPNSFYSTSKFPILPNGTTVDNGTYTIVITDGLGCVSNPNNTVVDVKDAPVTPQVSANTKTFCIGQKLVLTSNTYIGTTVQYKWNTPKGTFVTNIPSYVVDSMTLLNKGDYSLVVEIDGCESLASGITNIVVNPTPPAPFVSSNSPVCEGSDLLLTTSFVAGATYEWIGPKGFNSSIYNPVVTNINSDNSGFYRLRIIINGCPSKFAGELNAQINPRPFVPIISNNSPVCADKSGAAVTFTVSAASATTGATYAWSIASNNQLLSTTSSAGYTWSAVSTLPESVVNIYAIATSTVGCKSLASLATAVTINRIPTDKAFAGNDIPLCDVTTVKLNAQIPSIGAGIWTYTGTANPLITSPSLANTTITGLTIGQSYPLVWSLSNGACMNYSMDTTIVSVGGTAELADAGDTIHICSNSIAKLNAKAPIAGSTGKWTQAAAQAQLGVSILNPNNPKSDITGLQSGNSYVFTWSLSNAGCKDYSSDVAVVSVSMKDGKAFAGADFAACGEGNVALKGNAAPITGFGKWTSLTPNVNINAPNNAQTTALNVPAGTHQFVWSVGNAGCGFYSRDTVVVTFQNAAKATDDTFTIPYAQVSKLNVVANDVVANDYIIKIKTLAIHGTVQLSPNKGTLLYKPTQGYAGSDLFSYQICNSTCPDVCTDANVDLTIGSDTDCTIPNIFTPNNDGTNDYFEIPCLATAKYPKSSVIVVNQWGNEVFKASPYQNNWEGTYDGQALPAGTYYYIIDLGDGQLKKGFLILER